MLTTELNELLTNVGPGTPMGKLMREYWIPAMLSSELPKADSDPVRVLLLGERLIGFRDTSGRVALIQNLCPHRGASLFFGRNEEHGIRCVYHGWKFDAAGACVDMPNEPAASNFKSRIRAKAYPCHERSGLVWTYMGPREVPPPLPEIPGNMLPEGEYEISVFMRESNWLQNMEGELDTSHTNFLHSGADQPTDHSKGSLMYYALRDRAPRFSMMDTDYGLLYGAYRPAGEGETYWRLTQFLFPFHTNTGGMQNKSWVPMDDTHTMVFRTNRKEEAHGAIPLRENSTDWFGRFRPVASAENDYLIDRELQRHGHSFTGIPHGIPVEDQAVIESMGAIVDRGIENLATADTMVIRVRQRLIDVVRTLAEGKDPAPGVDTPEVYRALATGRLIMPEAARLADAAADLLRKPVSRSDMYVPWSQVDRS